MRWIESVTISTPSETGIFQILDKSMGTEVIDLFQSTFTDSEGPSEGELIGQLVSDLVSDLDNEDILCYGVIDESSLIASAFATRLRYQSDAYIYMLAPVAVQTKSQRQGIGKKLIAHIIKDLQERKVSTLITYGDPDYYGNAGFISLSPSVLGPPLELSMPFGWLGQSLSHKPISSMSGKPTCVAAFNNQAYW